MYSIVSVGDGTTDFAAHTAHLWLRQTLQFNIGLDSNRLDDLVDFGALPGLSVPPHS
jgi:hypothetical protein